jgi:hypothetical protein
MHMLDKTCTAYFFDFRADANIFVICSNSVEQSRFWCRAVFSSRWILSRWPFSLHSICLTSFGIHRNTKWHVKSKHENKIPLNVMNVMVGHKKHLKINMPTFQCQVSQKIVYFKGYASNIYSKCSWKTRKKK